MPKASPEGIFLIMIGKLLFLLFTMNTINNEVFLFNEKIMHKGHQNTILLLKRSGYIVLNYNFVTLSSEDHS